MYQGVEILDYTDLYEFINFKRQIPEVNTNLVHKYQSSQLPSASYNGKLKTKPSKI